MKIQIKKLTETAIIPQYKTEGAAAFDLCADIIREEINKYGTLFLTNGSHYRTPLLIPTGISMAIPEGYAGVIIPRSGQGHKRGLILGNSTGLIDSDYRGEIFVSLINRGPEYGQTIAQGESIAQMFILPVEQVDFELVDKLDDTKRGNGGFGSTDSSVNTITDIENKENRDE